MSDFVPHFACLTNVVLHHRLESLENLGRSKMATAEHVPRDTHMAKTTANDSGQRQVNRMNSTILDNFNKLKDGNDSVRLNAGVALLNHLHQNNTVKLMTLTSLSYLKLYPVGRRKNLIRVKCSRQVLMSQLICPHRIRMTRS